MLESDFVGLPAHTRQFVERIHKDGLDRVRIHGLFVLLGLCAGAPDTQDKINELFKTLAVAVPLDRTRNIDEVVGNVYDGYDREINEFCYRSGISFQFREIKIPNVERTIHIVDLKDHGLFNISITSIKKLADAFNLYDAFIAAIGLHTANRRASLVESFGCGIFQILLHARSDVAGTLQIVELIKSCLPLIYSQYFSTLCSNRMEYFLGLEPGQVPLLSLMQPMDLAFAQQMWGFQSSLFYRDQDRIEGASDLTIREWHAWIMKNARNFDSAYPTQLIPFSRANVTLTDVPLWPSGIESLDVCDEYIDNVWGYSAAAISSSIETLEYKALLTYLVYASLTNAREQLH